MSRLRELIYTSAELSQSEVLEFAELRLKGIHSLYFKDEVSMISVPDALHRQWDRIPPDFIPPLLSPEITRLEYSSDNQVLEVFWSDSQVQNFYHLEQIIDPGSSEGEVHRIEFSERLELSEIGSPAGDELPNADEMSHKFKVEVKLSASTQFSTVQC